MRNVLIFSLFLIGSFEVFANSQLGSFKTDYCTGYFEGTFREPQKWKHCCILHDMFLWAGGSKDHRDDSDLELKSCIEQTGEAHQAKIMYLAIRAASYSPVKLPEKAWSNGWRDSRPKYEALTSREVNMVENEINSNYEYIPLDMKKYFIHQLRSRLD